MMSADVTAYGAVGDGQSLSSAPFQVAIGAITRAGGGELYVPPGLYVLDIPLIVQNIPFAIRGRGRDVSILKWTAQGGLSYVGNGFRLTPGTFNGQGRSFRIEGVSLQTTLRGGGIAVQAIWDEATSMDAFFEIDDLKISGDGDGSQYWNRGIVLSNANGVKAHNFYIAGNIVVPDNTIPTPWGCDVGFHMTGGLIAGKISHFFTNFGIEECNRALRVDAWYEGIYMTNFELVNVAFGLECEGATNLRPAGNPNFFVQNGHINFRQAGTNIRNVLNPKFVNVDFYKDGIHPPNQSFPGNALALANCPNYSAIGCKFDSTSLAGTDENGIIADNTNLGGSTDGVITGCKIQGYRSSGIYTESARNNIGQNVIVGCGTAVTLGQFSNHCLVSNNLIQGRIDNRNVSNVVQSNIVVP